jgi:hypothetical protein
MPSPSPSQPAHLSNHQLNTLRQIFQHPAGHNIEWRAVLSLLGAVGSAEDRCHGKVAVTIGSQTECFDPPRHKDIDTQAVVNLRRMLAEAGYRADAADTRATGGPKAQIRSPGGAGGDQAGLVGEDDELRPVASAELDHRPADVGLGGGGAEHQGGGDLVVGQAVGD